MYIAVTPIASVKINKQEISALVDLGAKVSIISSDLAKKLRLSISYTFVVTIVGAIRASKRFIRLYENISININKIIHKTIV